MAYFSIGIILLIVGFDPSSLQWPKESSIVPLQLSYRTPIRNYSFNLELARKRSSADHWPILVSPYAIDPVHSILLRD